jgi:hypothetical protein
VRANPTGISTAPLAADMGWHTSESDQMNQMNQMPHQLNRNVADDMIRILMVLRGRKVCVSYDGYIGIVSMQTKADDWICVFHGTDVPFIVREHEDGYILIGDCYVQGLMQGLMQGEVVKKLEEGVLEAHTITLVW